MKVSLSYAAYNTLMYTTEAKAVRLSRELNFAKQYVFCPKGVRFGDWLDNLSMRELYAFYFTAAHSWVQFAVHNDPYVGRKECIRQARRYLTYATSTRKGLRPTRESAIGPITHC